jgi:hypothetical protein
MDTFIDIWHGAPQKIAAQDRTAHPYYASENVVNQIAAVGHVGGSGYERGKRAHDRNKSRQDNRLAAILLIKVMSALEMAAPEKQRIFTVIERLPSGAANQVPELVPDDRAKGNEKKQRRYRKMAGARKDACSYEKGIAGQEKAYEKAGLHKNDNANKQRSSPRHYSLNIVNGVEEMTYGFEQAANSPGLADRRKLLARAIA